MANVLKKITTAAKAYRKKHPATSWKSAVKKAGSMYRSGSLKAKRKSAPKKVARKRRVKRSIGSMVVTGAGKLKKRRRSVSRKKSAAPRKRRRSVSKKRAAPRRRRVGATKSDRLIQTLAIGGLAIGLIVAFTRQKNQPVYYQTGNPYRDSTATRILSIAQQAALSATQIAALIAKMNQSSDAQLQTISDQIDTGTSPAAFIAGY